MEEAKRLGSALHAALVNGAVRELYLSSKAQADAHDRGLRVTLALSEAPKLLEIPWEFMYERPRFLAASMYTPVIRSLDLESTRPPRKVVLPLRILGIVSRPAGADELDVDVEREKLESALRPLSRAGIVELVWLPRATLTELQRRIGQRDDIHVLHFVGHGEYDARSQTGLLIFEDERGEAHEVTGEELGTLLHDERSLRLAVLNSCEGARNCHHDPFSGVASALVESGIPAVIGMQFKITDKAAVVFAEGVYTALAHGYAVDAAVAQARLAIFAARKDDVEFGTPVLFTGSGETQLFQFELPTDRDRKVEPGRSPGAAAKEDALASLPSSPKKPPPRPSKPLAPSVAEAQKPKSRAPAKSRPRRASL